MEQGACKAETWKNHWLSSGFPLRWNL